MFARDRTFYLYLLRHGLGGVVGGLVASGGVLALDLGGLGSLILGSQSPALALFMLFFGFSITFGGAALGAALIQIGNDDG